MRIAFAFCLLLVAVSAAALEIFPGSGETVLPPQDRDYSFAYHTGSDDFRLYGSNLWAVRFDFGAVYPTFSLCEFAVQRALLYFPQTGDSVKVELFSEVAGLPGQRLTWTQAEVQSNVLSLDFPQTVQAEVLWMLVSYSTNFSNRFVSASAGGGTRSYYWNTNVQHPYFQSLASAGFNCELLFGVGGEFVLSDFDLELTEIDVVGLVAPREDVYPTFSLYNHSDLSISDAVVNFRLLTPEQQFNQTRIISVADIIAPRSSYTWDPGSPGYYDHLISLPEQPMQMRLRATISSSQAEPDTLNNSRDRYIYSFSHSSPVYLTENFLRYSFASPLLALQDQYNPANLHSISYFPVLGDTLANVGAVQHFNWYGFNSLPRTVLGGNRRITGYTPSYANQYDLLAAETVQEKTFVSSSECRLTYTQQNDAVSAAITFTNQDTALFATTADYNLISNTRLFIGLYRKEQILGGEYYVLSRWITHNATLGGPLGAGESLSTTDTILLNNLSLAELNQNYRLYYWLQVRNGGRILYSAWSDFSSVVSAPDELSPPVELLSSSNPLRAGNFMQLRLSNSAPIHRLMVYNLKGQLIHSLDQPHSEIILSERDFPASGIYLVKAVYRDDRHGFRHSNLKISVIK